VGTLAHATLGLTLAASAPAGPLNSPAEVERAVAERRLSAKKLRIRTELPRPSRDAHHRQRRHGGDLVRFMYGLLTAAEQIRRYLVAVSGRSRC
jgi:hypothetical protein